MAKKKRNKSGKAPVIGIVTVLIVIGAMWAFIQYKKDGYIGPQEFTYPTKYEEYVLKYSKQYGVEPEFVYAVIKTESSFNENAVSEVGARGLMQLMEDAYSWVKFRINDDDEYDFDKMFDPETNIHYGTYYLSYLLEKYNGSIELSAAAYHCGMGTVDAWLENGTVSYENFDVDDIPDENDQTSHYVKKINKAYNAYKKILKEES